MAVYTVTHKQLLDNYGVLQLLTTPELQAGETITVASVDATFNGSRTVYARPEYLYIGTDAQGDLVFDYNVTIENQVLFALTGSDVTRTASTGTITHSPTCTWITAGQIEDWLGIGTATAADTTFLTQCAAAANNFCYRRRQEAGYTDLLGTSPGGDVTLGTIMLGGAYYRNRGSIDQFSSFSDGGNVSVTGLSGMIKQLLGIDRPQVA